MRTTINLSPEVYSLVKQYTKHCAKSAKSNVSMAIEEALDIALPIMIERLPRKGESTICFLQRRAVDIQQKLSSKLSQCEILSMLREITRYQTTYYRILFASTSREILTLFLDAFSTGWNLLKREK
jgi:hypothetical protein